MNQTANLCVEKVQRVCCDVDANLFLVITSIKYCRALSHPLNAFYINQAGVKGVEITVALVDARGNIQKHCYVPLTLAVSGSPKRAKSRPRIKSLQKDIFAIDPSTGTALISFTITCTMIKAWLHVHSGLPFYVMYDCKVGPFEVISKKKETPAHETTASFLVEDILEYHAAFVSSWHVNETPVPVRNCPTQAGDTSDATSVGSSPSGFSPRRVRQRSDTPDMPSTGNLEALLTAAGPLVDELALVDDRFTSLSNWYDQRIYHHMTLIVSIAYMQHYLFYVRVECTLKLSLILRRICYNLYSL